MWAEKALARNAPQADEGRARIQRPALVRFLVAVLLLALAYQVNTFINSGPLFSKFASPGQLPNLLSLFWIGFSVAMLPASFLTKRLGGVGVMAAGALMAAVAACVAKLATGVVVLSAAQFVCGCAWGAVTMSAVAAALQIGRGGKEGTVVGAMSSVLAAAAVVRIAVVAGEFGDIVSPALLWLPVIAWLVGGLLLAPMIRHKDGVDCGLADGSN